jgi:putative transposase
MGHRRSQPRLTRKLKITHGMSNRDIIHHLRQVYGTLCRSRPLDPVYAVVFLDAIVVKVRDSQVVQTKSAYIAVGAVL